MMSVFPARAAARIVVSGVVLAARRQVVLMVEESLSS